MERLRDIERRVAVAESVTVSFLREAKERPTDMFGAVFYDIREKAKTLKKGWEDKAVQQIEADLKADMEGRNVPIADLKISLGQYRGSRFVTSASFKAKVKDEEAANQLLGYLQSKYSPKYKLKSFNAEEGVATYNVR